MGLASLLLGLIAVVPLLGHSEEQIASFGLTFGMTGFVAKILIQWVIGIK